MAGPVSDAYLLAYQLNVELAIQQKKSKLEPAFTYHGGLSGRLMQILDLVGTTTAIIDGNRGGDTPNIDNTVEPVWILPRQIEWGKLIEKEDVVKALTDFNSPFVQAGAAAVQVAKDTILAAAVFGSRKIGQDGGTTSSYTNTNVQVTEGIGSSDDLTATGMNVKKCLRARRYYQAAYGDIENAELMFLMNAKEVEDLYRDITYVNKDYRDRAVLDGRLVLNILDTPIIQVESLPNLDSDTHRAAMVDKAGLHWGEFSAVQTSAAPNPAKKYRIHPYMETWIGATRSEDARVIEILNHF